MKKKVRELKKGDYFTKKDISEPDETQVWVRGDYCREDKKYIIYKFSDVNHFGLMSGDKEVYTEFYF